jgi:mRNA interferase MazF
MFPFGTIVLTRFPFTDLSEVSRRPALVVSAQPGSSGDFILCFITSVTRTGPHAGPLSPDGGTGLKVRSLVRFDKLATLHASVIVGLIGEAPAEWLAAHASAFFAVFGFRPPL